MASDWVCRCLINLTIAIKIPFVFCDLAINDIRITGVKGNFLANIRIIFTNFELSIWTILDLS